MAFSVLRRGVAAARFIVNDLGAWKLNRSMGDDVISALPSVYGSWPVQGEGAQLFAACDPLYFQQHAKGLIASVTRNSPSTSIHLHLYNPTNEIFQILENYKRKTYGGLLTFTWENVSINNMDWHEKSIYLASMRFPRLYSAIKSSKRPILSIDVDCFVRKDLNQYFDQAKHFDAGLVLRPEFRDRAKRVLAVAVYVAPTMAGMSFFGEAACRMAAHLAHRRATEKLDQRCLWSAYRLNANRVKIWQIPRELADFEFQDASAIWTGKGHRKKLPQYLDEIGSIISDFEGHNAEHFFDDSENKLHKQA